MPIKKYLLDRLGNPLEWSSAAKAAMLTSVTALMHLQYLLWVLYLLEEPAYWAQINVPFIRAQLPWFYFWVSISCTLVVLPLLGQRFLGDWRGYEHISAQYYGLSLCYFGYLIGTLSVATGAVVAAAPVVGFIFFNRLAVVLAFVTSLTVILTLTYMAAAGLILYAPAVVPITADGQITMFWAHSMLIYTVPHLLSLLAAAAYILGRWRYREAQVQQLSMTDSLTGLANRGHIVTTLTTKLAHAQQHRSPVAVVMVDLDHFKQVNDSRGHLTGDRALRAAAAVLSATIRQHDAVGRYGGEEFLIVLPDTDAGTAAHVAERCRQALADQGIETDGDKTLRITASFGVASNEHQCDWDADALLQRADQALYQAKAEGRNRVVRWTSTAAEPLADGYNPGTFGTTTSP